jgi:homoserine O-acetyltransferase
MIDMHTSASEINDNRLTDRSKSVGIVRRQSVRFDKTLTLESGAKLPSFTIAYETYGRLNDARSNAILIFHALSGDSHVAGYYTDDPDEPAGWWDDAVGSGKMFDTDRYFVICANVLGGCQGSTGPASIAPDGKPYGLRFPVITIGDMVQAQRHLIDALGIDRLFAVAGGSMGGMQALQWAVNYPDRVGAVLFLASTPRSSAQNIAFNEIGRQAIYADPNWRKGDYYGSTPPVDGLSIARMIGHITYMSEYSLEQKFSRRLQAQDQLGYHFETEFEIESYLKYQGEKFTQRFDANSYLYITKALDYFDIGRGGSIKEALAQVKARLLVVSFSSDWLYTADQARLLVDALPPNQVDYHHVKASLGHDSFLVEADTMTAIVGGYLTQLRLEQGGI